ncbi:cyclic nucleotide-binding domain protein (macronuclear) [Tetrahymena thermophila SB210]|uniref:Cyclic nucleotide-binding domain protein n=1 Tax=Tetrahymena thermophila (strain SB210) TaxID=312017 RepID=I7LTI0_TETTS|nr:cyclic nucleotide-binding domain protein [Tetrahymena thermophila SB210]EAR85283.2 cyclic nucleotide-binding domain protein [Tetrahymena thermophila SB210]|eukprot:XP_001032946.2 cyclic nucleotide-binding domain protein [Tetrahymena thermophila SB210]
MHNQQGQIFNYQSNEDWKELQKLNRRKEESFQSDLPDIFSTSQLKSPQYVDKMNYLQVKNIEICSPRIEFFNNKNLQEDSIAEKFNNKENLEELSATRNPDQSKNLLFLIPQRASQQNLSQLVSYKNNESATLALSKGQNNGLKNIQNIANNNINMIMNLKKKVSLFIQQYTLFGKSSLLDKNPIIRRMINDKSDGNLESSQTFMKKLFNFLYFFSATKENKYIENCILGITFYLWMVEIILKLNTATFYKTHLFNTRLQQEMEKNLMMIMDNFFYIQLINLIVNLFLIGHVIACIWYAISIIDQNYLNNEDSWVKSSISTNGVWWEYYLNAFYWSFTLMATGSNIASTILEMFFTSIAMIFIITIFGYMVSMIGIILEEMNKMNENKLRDINIINKYMKRKHITKDLKARVNLDLEYLYLRSMKQKSDDEYNVLSKISPDLQNEIKIEYTRNIISKIKCLMNNFSESTINQVCLELQEEFYSPNQILFNQEEIGDSSLIFLVSGQIELFQNIKFLKQNEDSNSSETMKQIDNKIEKQSKLIYSHKKGSVFGELNFFTGMGRTLTAKSKQFSTVLKLRRDSFLNIIKNNQQDFEKFCEIRDKILMYSDISPLEQNCQICLSPNHFESQCIQAHINKKNPFLFAKFNYSVTQDREYQFKRNRTQKVNVISALQKVQEKAEQIQQNYELSSFKNPEDNTEQPSLQDQDDDEDDEDEYTYDKSSPQNEEAQNSKLSNLINYEKDLEYSITQEQQITYPVSRFSLQNGFTIEDKTRKTSQSIYRNEIQPQSPKEARDSLLKNNLYDESLSINIQTQYNNLTNTPKAQSRGVTQYQSSAERTEFTAFMKEMNQQDSIREQDLIQKELLKKNRNQKVFQENMRRYSLKTDNTKKKSKYNNRRSTYLEIDLFKANDIHQKQLLHNHEITFYERQVTHSLWNLDGIKVYSNYFPSGNYVSAITKFNQLRKKCLKLRQLSLQDKQKSSGKKKTNQ